MFTLLERFLTESCKNGTNGPIIADVRNPTNQSELDLNTCTWCQGWKNVRRQVMIQKKRKKVMIHFGFISDWKRKWSKIF